MASRIPFSHGRELNHGLVFHRGRGNFDSPDAKGPHVGRVASLPHPTAYRTFFERWKTSLAALRRDDNGSHITAFAQLRTMGRLIVGLGSDSVIETSIAFHRVYGVPYLPGSALKGVARRFARQALGDAWAEGAYAFNVMFGKTDDNASFRGLVTFHDALPLPGKWHLVPDTITVHHSEYYTSTKANVPPPSDGDEPQPVPFLAVTGEFLLPLSGPLAWVGAAKKILSLALSDCGIGAKTAIGYGRMTILEENAVASAAATQAGHASRSGGNANRPSSAAGAWPKTLTCDVLFTTVRPGQHEYATSTFRLSDGRVIQAVAFANTEGLSDVPNKKNTIGPARCDLEHLGQNRYRVLRMRRVEG